MSNSRLAVIVTNGLGTGGAEAMLQRVVEGLEKRSGEIHVINLSLECDRQEDFERLGVTVHNIPLSKPQAAFQKWIRLSRKLKSQNILCIIGWMYIGNIFALLIHYLLPKRPKIIWSIRQSLDFWKNEKLTTKIAIYLCMFLSQYVDEVIYNSFKSSNQHGRFGFRCKKHTVIHNGFEVFPIEKYPETRAQIRKALGIKETDTILGFVGRFHKVKGYDLLAASWQMMRAQGCNLSSLNDVYLYGLGEGLPAGWNDKKWSVDNVFLFEKTQNVQEHMCAFDGLILPSYAEAFPNVVGEAMSVGLPVIASDVGDVELILPPENFIFPRGDVFELKIKIEEFLALGVEERLIIGEQNRKIINNDYNIKDVTNAYKRAFGL